MQNRTKVREVHRRLKMSHGVRLVEARELAKKMAVPIESAQYALRYLSDLGLVEFQSLGWQLTELGATGKFDWNRPAGWNKSVILQYLEDHGPSTAKEIAKACDIAHQNVNKYARTMMKEGTITADVGETVVGRPPLIYRAKPWPC